MPNRYLRILILLATGAGLAWAQQQVTMPQSPATGNPANLVINANYSNGIYGLHFMIGSPVSGTFQGTCYIQMAGGTMVALYDTESGNLVESGMGYLGTIATLNSTRCSVDLAASSLSGNVYSLRISSPAPNGTSLPVYAEYSLMSCEENCPIFVTLGSWTVQAGTPPPVQPGILTGPTPGSTLPGAGAIFSWTAGSGISSYALDVGTYPGANNLASQSTTALSLTIYGLPTNGSTVYVKLSSWTGSQWLSNSYTFTANTPVVPVQIISPAPGSIISTASPTIQVSTGVNVGDTWLQTGRAAGSGEAYEYSSRARDIGVPHVELAVPQIFVTVSSAFQGGWLAQSAVYGTPSGGAPTSRASRLTAPALGAMLSGFATFQWDTGSGVSKVRFTAGSEAGWTNLADQEYYSGTYSAQLFVPATGRKVFITLWSLIGTSWQANSYVFDTWNQNATVSASTAPAQLLLPTAPIANSTYTFQWIPGTGASLYWLSVGSTVDGTDYYNERNIGTSTLSATVRALPANNTRVYATLYSRINNTWIPYRASVIMAVRPVGEIPQQFLDCIKSGADPVCTLPEGTYYMWNTKATKVVSVPGPSGSTTTLQLNAPIVIERSGITVHGTEPRPKLVRYDPALYLSINPAVPTPGCQHLMEIAPGVSNLIIENIEFEGSAGAYSGHCKPNSSAAAQPAAQDLSFQGQNSNVTIRDSEFRNAISTALLIYAPNIDGVTITGTRFVEPNLAGILVGNNFVWDGGSAPNYIPQHAFLLPNGQPGGCDVLAGGLPAAATADVPRNILISWNIFLRSWTGALALNRSRQVTVQYNSFTDNYQRPYDDGGGSMNTTECDYDTKIVGNIFNAAGLNLPEGKGTIALELSGIKEYVEGNTIQGYPSTMIVARNSKDLSIIGNNQLNGNGRLNFRTEDPVSTDARVRQDSGIELWNQYKFRAMTGVKIENNTIANPSMAGTFPYAIRVRRHSCSPVLAPDPGNQCSMSQTQSWVYGLRVKGNTFNNMSVAPYCIMSGVKPPQGLPEFPDWDLQGGWATCIEPLP